MEVKINIYSRKSNHWKFVGDDRYNIREDIIVGDTEQDILDKFYIKNRNCDMSYYHQFQDEKWERKLHEWYKSDDYKKRSFSLFYKDRIVD